MGHYRARLAVLLCGVCAYGLLSAEAPAANLLTNGSFDKAEPAWLFHTEKDAEATFSVEQENGNAVGHVIVTRTGKLNHVQFACPVQQASLTMGKVHCVTFRCRSSQSRSVRAALIEAGKPWGSAGLGTNVPVTSEWTSHEFCFRPQAVPSPDLKLNFLLGDVGGDFWLDDVTLTAAAKTRPDAAQQLLSGAAELGLGSDGAVISLKHRSAGTEVVGGIGRRPAFKLGLRRGSDALERSSVDAVRIVPEKGKAGAYLAEFPDMTVRFSYEPAERAGLFDCRIAVENRSDWAIERVTFPILDCPETLGETSEDDRLLVPTVHGGLIENPREAMARRGVSCTYPGWTSCQIMSFYDPKAGLYAACHDTAGNVKELKAGLHLNLRLSFDHFRPLDPGKDVILRYPIVIGAFAGGTWYEPASIYRDWSLAQEWLPKPLKCNERLPEWMRGGAIVDFHEPVDRAGQILSDDAFRQRLDAIRKVSGLNVLSISWGWERYGKWVSQEYFPAQPSDDAFRRHGAISCESGSGMVMLSGLRWTFEKQLRDGTLYSGKERFDREVKPWVTHTKSPDTPTIETDGKPTHYKGSGHGEMCPATGFAADTFVSVAKRCVESGYPAIHFDHPTGPAYCLAPHHGHSPGYGTWYHEGIADLYGRIRATCAPLDKKFVLSMEESRELYLRECQLIQTRAQRLISRTWPVTRDIPLFQFLYHEYQVAWCSAFPAHCHGHIRPSLAKGFAIGLMPGVVWDWVMNIEPAEKREEYLAVFSNYCRLYREEGLDFLLYGRMLRPLPINIPVREIQILDKKSKKELPLAVPAVYHSVWQAQDGRRAVIFFNPEDAAHAIRLPDGRDVTVPPRDGLLCELSN